MRTAAVIRRDSRRAVRRDKAGILQRFAPMGMGGESVGPSFRASSYRAACLIAVHRYGTRLHGVLLVTW